MATRRWLLGALIFVGLVALAVPAPARRPAAPPSAEQQVAAHAQHTILRPDQPYDAGGINEPTVLFWRGRWWLWYVALPRGQTDERRILTCLATAPGGADPTVAANWTKHGPVVGAPALEPSVIALPNGTLRLYSSTHAGLRVLDSVDGLHWRARGTALAAGVAGVSWWADSTVWQDAPNADRRPPNAGLWQGLFEGGGQAGPWHIYHGTSPDGLTFTLDGHGPLLSLAVGRGGMEGGPTVPVPQRLGGLYHLWYHAGFDGGWSRANIYHATSPDLLTWTPDQTPVVTPPAGGRIVDNAALVAVRGQSYLFWGGGAGRGGIHVARHHGPLAHV